MSTHVDPPRHLSSLPEVRTPILGREQEISMLRALMGDDRLRMVTITGPGGVGKTRLAIEAVSGAGDNVDIVFVPLAAVREPERIVPAIGRAIGLNLEPREEGEEALFRALGGHTTVLVLDNLEQIRDMAPVVNRLLERVPDLTILATSQVLLGAEGEYAFPLRPLPVPLDGEGDALASDAVRLFLQRAGMVDATLAPDEEAMHAIAAICRRLDGLPLAIELAAARVSLLSPPALLARLDDQFGVLRSQRPDVDERHRTLRGAISWSYDLLDHDAQRLFRRLAVFSGVAPDAALAVAGTDDAERVTSVLEELHRRNLLQPVATGHGDARFVMLESLREFGVAQLAARGEEEPAREAHATWFAELAEQAAPHLRAGDQATWLARLATESENLRAAVTWSLETGQQEIAARIIGAIWRFFGNHAMITDARAWVAKALSGTGPISPWHRADALVAAGYLSLLYHRDRDAGERYMEQALELSSAIGHRVAEMRAYGGLGIAAYDRGDYPRATEMYTRGQDLAREVGTASDVAIASNNLGLVAYVEGKVDETLRYWEEAVRLTNQDGDRMMEAQVQANLGGVKNALGRIDEAREHLQRALELQRSINNRSHLPNTLINSGENDLLRGDIASARAHYSEAREILRQTGNVVYDAAAVMGVAAVSIREGNAREAASLILEAQELLGENREPMRIIELTETMAATCGIARNHEGAVSLIAAAKTLRDEHGNVAPIVGAGDLDALLREAREAMGDDAFDAAWRAGNALDIDGMKSQASIQARGIIGRQVDEPAIQWLEDDEPVDVVETPDYHLTARELEILRLLGQGKTTQEISTELLVSPRTVSTHVANVMSKLDVTTRTAAVAQALRDGVIRPAL